MSVPKYGIVGALQIALGKQVYKSSTPFQKLADGDSHLQGPWLACPLPSWSYSKLLAPPQHSAGSGTYGYSPRQALSGIEDGQAFLGAVAPQQHPGATDTSFKQNTQSDWHLTSTYGAWTSFYAPCHSLLHTRATFHWAAHCNYIHNPAAVRYTHNKPHEPAPQTHCKNCKGCPTCL